MLTPTANCAVDPDQTVPRRAVDRGNASKIMTNSDDQDQTAPMITV